MKKLKIALLDVKVGTSMKSKFTAVNMRNFEILANELEADFIYSENDIRLNNIYDICIVGFGAKNSEINKCADFLKNRCSSIFIMVGEYLHNDHPALFYSKRKFHVIRNYYGKNLVGSKKLQLSDNILNINLLIVKNENKRVTKLHDCIYYGRYRLNRGKYYNHYLHYPIWLSSDVKNFKKYKNNNCTSKNVGKLKWEQGEGLDLFRYSIYIEDEYTHENYNYLANRWYEAGISNNVVFFDYNCMNTIKKSEIAQFEDEIMNYIIWDYDSLIDKINYCNQDFEKHLAIQKKWRISEQNMRIKMINEFKHILKTNYENDRLANLK